MGIPGESRGSWSPSSCNFQLGFHLVLEETGLPPSSLCPACLLREGMPQVVPAHCTWDTETQRWLLPEPRPRRCMLCFSLLFSSFSSQDQRDVKHFGRAATLKTASVE